jgi:hypothetical protein
MNVKLGKDRKFKSEAQSHIGDIKKFLMQSYAADRYKYGKQ